MFSQILAQIMIESRSKRGTGFALYWQIASRLRLMQMQCDTVPV